MHFPNVKTTEPEMLAHHLTVAGLTEAAIPLWQVAGELALKRMALTEAVSHLDRGLELIATLPRSSQRDTSELELRSLLGTAWLGLKGWAAPEVWTNLHPALALAKSLERHDALAPIYWGLAANVVTQGRIAEVLAVGAGDAGLRDGGGRCGPATRRTHGCLHRVQLGRRVHQGSGARRQRAEILRRRRASPSCRRSQPGSQDYSWRLRVDEHLDTRLPGPCISIER